MYNVTETLFIEHNARLTQFAHRLVGVDADDLVQETFLKVHRHVCKGNEIREPLRFLYITLRNLASDIYRKNKIEYVDIDITEIVSDDGTPSIERQVISEQEFDVLCNAIVELPIKMRYAFVLRKVYGYSCREIADKLGRSPNTVREQVAQGCKKLLEIKS